MSRFIVERALKAAERAMRSPDRNKTPRHESQLVPDGKHSLCRLVRSHSAPLIREDAKPPFLPLEEPQDFGAGQVRRMSAVYG